MISKTWVLCCFFVLLPFVTAKPSESPGSEPEPIPGESAQPEVEQKELIPVPEAEKPPPPDMSTKDLPNSNVPRVWKKAGGDESYDNTLKSKTILDELKIEVLAPAAIFIVCAIILITGTVNYFGGYVTEKISLATTRNIHPSTTNPVKSP